MFLNLQNFILDKETYEDYKHSLEKYDNDGYDWDDDWDWDDDDWGGGGWDDDYDSGGGGFRILVETNYGTEGTANYIKKFFNYANNIDKSFKNVTENLYVGNYIGFKDYNSMNKFMDIDLHYLYLSPFPNVVSMIFCYFSIITLLVLNIISLCRCCHEDRPNEYFNKCRTLLKKLCIIIPYLIIFIGYFIYVIYSFCFIFIKSNLEDITKVNADEFIEDLMSEVKEQNGKKLFHLTVIILFSFSITSFLLAWILSQIFTCRYLKLVEIARGTDPIYRRSV